MRTPELRVNSGVWWGFVMRIRINLSSLPLTPTVLFSGVISTLVTHLFLLPSCHHSPFLFTSLYHLLISSFPACTTAPNGEHVLIIFPGDINWTGCSNLLSCIWTPEYVGSFFFFFVALLVLVPLCLVNENPSLKSSFWAGPLHIVLSMQDLENSILSKKESN